MAVHLLLQAREVLKVRRDKGALIAKFGIALVLNLLYGLIFLGVGGRDGADADHMTAHFGVIMMAAISSMFGAAQPIMMLVLAHTLPSVFYCVFCPLYPRFFLPVVLSS